MLRGSAIYPAHHPHTPCGCPEHPGVLCECTEVRWTEWDRKTQRQVHHSRPVTRCLTHQWLDDGAYRPKTRQAYLSTLRCFQNRLNQRDQARHGGGPVDPRRVTEVNADHIRQFIDVSDDGRPRADATRNRTLSALSEFFGWASDPEVGVLTGNPTTRLRRQHRRENRKPVGVIEKTWLGEERAMALIATIAGGNRTRDLLDAYILRICLYSGARVTELINLRWSDAKFTAGQLWISGKRGKRAPVDMHPALRKTLLAWRSLYIEGLGHDRLDDLPIIPKLHSAAQGGLNGSARTQTTTILWGVPYTNTTPIYKMVVARGAAIGLKLAPHDLRRSWAGILEDRGKSEEVIRDALRHDDTKTTRVYLADKPRPMGGLEDLDLG